MILPDVNLLVYAYMDSDWQHAPARLWWLAMLDGQQAIGLCSLSLFGFIRLTTNRRLFKIPLAVDKSISFVESWLAHPQTQLLHPGPRHLEIALSLLRETGAGGDLTTDVQIASLAIENQAELHSADTDFARFSGLRWVNPLKRK